MSKRFDRGEIVQGGKEIFSNGKYKDLPSWEFLVAHGAQSDLLNILSIKAVEYGGIIKQYNIETENHFTNLTTHQGLDFIMTQVNKQTKEMTNFTRYSNPSYHVFLYMACAYYEVFGNKPRLAFPYTDVDEWNKDIHNVPLHNEMTNATHDLAMYSYLNHKDLFVKDAGGIWMPPPQVSGSKFGIRDMKEALLFLDAHDGLGIWNGSEELGVMTIPVELLHVFMQMFVDVNRSVSGPVVNLHCKKLHDALFATLSMPGRTEKDNFLFKSFFEPLSTD